MFMEAAAYYANQMITPAYYDVALKTKYARDDESQQMLDIIFADGTVDLSTVYDWGGAANAIRGQLYTGKTEVVSMVEKRVAKIVSGIQDTVDALANLD